MKFDFAKKFLSRKFLVAVIGTLVGLAIYFGADGSEIKEIAGAVTSAVSAVAYIFGEAMVDAAAVGSKVDDEPEETSIGDGDNEITDWK